MKKRYVLISLMAFTLCVIAGFQVYWLGNTFDREKRTLLIRTNMLFQESMHDLQVEKLRLSEKDNPDTAGRKTVRLTMRGDISGVPRQQALSMVNLLRRRLHDSVKGEAFKTQRSDVFIAIRQGDSAAVATDSLQRLLSATEGPAENRIFRFLSGVDSLQDTLRLSEIRLAYEISLRREKLPLQFEVHRLAVATPLSDPDVPEITVGFAKPVTYRLHLLNTNAYLLKKMALPILFSLFLVGASIACFLLLYRNLLKQEKLAAIKNDFISNITHELKTPIATVSVAVEALKNFNAMHDVARTKEYLDISSNELQRLSLLVDKVLKLSMLEKKEIELRKEPTALLPVVEEVINSMRLQFDKQQATVHVQSSGDTLVTADRLHLLSIVYNLLDNAIKYAGPQPQINIQVTGGSQQVELTVTDNGIGIAPEYHTKVFEKFFRVPTGDTHTISGYGLGLSYVAHIIAQHRGSIQLQSSLANGSRFIIKLPR